MFVTGKTGVIGIFGNPIEHSLSPVMHNRAFDYLGLDYCYVPFLVAQENIAAAVESIRALNLKGVNVTIPHKAEVMKYLDEVTTDARNLGAVNTIVNDGGRLIGYNTDGAGFYQSLVEETGQQVTGKKVLILGAGGAARGVAFQLASRGAAGITFANRSLEKAAVIVEELNRLFPHCRAVAVENTREIIAATIPKVDILINSTPIGMYPHQAAPSPIDCNLIRPGLVVCDLIYNPLETTLLREAKSQGAVTVSGLGMLLYQGAIAFELWTGVKAPVQVMREALISGLAK